MELISDPLDTDFTPLLEHAKSYPLKKHFFEQNIKYLKHLENLINQATSLDLSSFHAFKNQIHSLLELQLNNLFKTKLQFAQRRIAQPLERIRSTHQKVLSYLSQSDQDLTPSELIKLTQEITLLQDRASLDQKILSQTKLQLSLPLAEKDIKNLLSSVAQLLFEIRVEQQNAIARKVCSQSQLIQPLPSTSDILLFGSQEKLYVKRKNLDCAFPQSRFGVLNLSDCAIVAGGKKNGNVFTQKVFKILCNGQVSQLSALRKAKCSFPLVSLRSESLIFSLGGYNGLDLSEVEMYSRTKDHWFQMPSLVNAKCAQAGCHLEENHIFAFAGNNLGQELNEVERFNIAQLFEGWKLLHISFQIKGNYMSATSIGPAKIQLWGFQKSFEIEFQPSESLELEVKSIIFKRGFQHSWQGGATYKLLPKQEDEENQEKRTLVSFTTDLDSVYIYREHEWVS